MAESAGPTDDTAGTAQPRILTSVALVVPQDREIEVIPAYGELTAEVRGLRGLFVPSCFADRCGRWLIQTSWRDRAAIMAARHAGADRAERSHEVLTVEETLDA